MRALIFDCDGVLGETESRGHLVAFNRMFTEYGVPWQWSLDEYRRMLGIGGGKERLLALMDQPELQSKLAVPQSVGERRELVRAWHQRKSEIYREIVNAGEIPARPGVRRLAEEALAAGWRLAVASTSAEPSVRAMMRNVFGDDLSGRFSVVLAGDCVQRKKPDPEIYQLCGTNLNARPEDCVVVEDSEIGLAAARAAGMPCLVTISEMTVGGDFTGARRVVSSLDGGEGEPAVTVSDLMEWGGDMHSEVPAAAKAAVYDAPKQPMRLRDFSVPALKGSEALVRVRCATICGSDLHTFFGRRKSPAPSVLGHEMVGDLVAVGPDGVRDVNGEPLEAGARITWSMVWSCGECFYCRNGLAPKCERLLKFGHEALRPGLDLLGGFAEYCFLPERTAICRVPDNVPDAVASPANCATATVAAVVRHAGSLAGANVVVYGAGMLGLSACAMAQQQNAAQVIAIESDPRRAELAKRFGASAVLDGLTGRVDLVRGVKDITGGRGVEFVLELTGIPEAMETGFELLRFGGSFMMAGATFSQRPIAVDAEQLVRRMIRMQGVYNYEPRDLQAALSFLADNVERYPFLELIGRTFPLDQIQDAFDFAETERPPRVAVRPF